MPAGLAMPKTMHPIGTSIEAITVRTTLTNKVRTKQPVPQAKD